MTDQSQPIPRGVEAVRQALLDTHEPRSSTQTPRSVETIIGAEQTLPSPEASPFTLARSTVAVCLIGAMVGIAPQILNDTPKRPPIAGAHNLQVVVNDPIHSAKLPPVVDRLEVLPVSAAPPAPSYIPADVRRTEHPKATPPPSPPPPVKISHSKVTPVSLPAPRPPARKASGPGFDCSGRLSYAEQMVCGDGGLGDADRAMVSAYRRAAKSGVPMGILEEGHDQWVADREDAARHGPTALSNLYAGRIVELLELGDDARRF